MRIILSFVVYFQLLLCFSSCTPKTQPIVCNGRLMICTKATNFSENELCSMREVYPGGGLQYMYIKPIFKSGKSGLYQFGCYYNSQQLIYQSLYSVLKLNDTIMINNCDSSCKQKQIDFFIHRKKVSTARRNLIYQTYFLK